MYLYIYDYVCIKIYDYMSLVGRWETQQNRIFGEWLITSVSFCLFKPANLIQQTPIKQGLHPASMVVGGDVPRLLRWCFQRCFHLGNPCVWRAAPPVRGRYSIHHRCWRRGRQRSCSVVPRYLNRFSKPSRSVGTIEWCRDWGSGLFRSCRQHGFTWGLETDRYWLFMYTVYVYIYILYIYCIYIYMYVSVYSI